MATDGDRVNRVGGESSADEDPKALQAQREKLDGLVVNMELTLISIIQGVALYFLTDSSRTIVTGLNFQLWPHIGVGLVTILLFWSRSLIHTITVIRWPLEFGHNFLYITCTLIEAITFTQVANVRTWYICNGVYGCVIWFLFYFDLGMIRRRNLEANGPEGKELCRLLERDQILNVRLLMPVLVGYHILVIVISSLQPVWFFDEGWHLLFGIVQFAGGLLYLGYVLRFFYNLTPLIARGRESSLLNTNVESNASGV